MIIALIGFRCTGKSTTGKILAEKLDIRHIDLDKYIEKENGKSVNDILRYRGENVFRDYETAALKSVLKHDNSVIACGGGVVMREENIRLLRQNVTVIWLEASARTIAERMQKDASNGIKRPSLTGIGAVMEITTLLAERLPFYAGTRHVGFETDDKSPEEVADRIIAYLKNKKR